MSNHEELALLNKKLLENNINTISAQLTGIPQSWQCRLPHHIINSVVLSYLEMHKAMYRRGVEISPNIHSFLIGGNLPPDGEAIVMALYRMRSVSNTIHHKSEPLATNTGRDSIRGPSITSIKKALWQYLLAPAPGFAYILLDYSSQEPAIAACLANDLKLQNAAQEGKFYLHIRSHSNLADLDDKTSKQHALTYLYGQRPESFAKEHHIPLMLVQRRWEALREVFHQVDTELNRRSQQAFQNGFVRSLDWAAWAPPLSNPLAVRNWPVQAAGADIMRRAVIGLAKEGIDLRLTIHDAFLIRVPIAKQDQQVAKAIEVLKQASAMVLDGFKLNVKVDGIYDGQISREMM